MWTSGAAAGAKAFGTVRRLSASTSVGLFGTGWRLGLWWSRHAAWKRLDVMLTERAGRSRSVVAALRDIRGARQSGRADDRRPPHATGALDHHQICSREAQVTANALRVAAIRGRLKTAQGRLWHLAQLPCLGRGIHRRPLQARAAGRSTAAAGTAGQRGRHGETGGGRRS